MKTTLWAIGFFSLLLFTVIVEIVLSFISFFTGEKKSGYQIDKPGIKTIGEENKAQSYNELFENVYKRLN